MRSLFWFLAVSLYVLLANSGAACADSAVDELLKKVVVEGVELNLNAPVKQEGSLLWQHFANQPYEKQFSRLSTKDWFSNWQKFYEKLLERAKVGGFDVKSLSKVLNGLRPNPFDKLARIPVGAFAAWMGAEKVWIIVLKWEYAGKEEFSLGHIEVIAFRMSDGKKVDSVKCG